MYVIVILNISYIEILKNTMHDDMMKCDAGGPGSGDESLGVWPTPGRCHWGHPASSRVG